ncbi:MAG: hypothetical protein IKM43_00955 [Clostridia bacterium]|nr:hypothetical protein [Clostridia bacterium]
MKTLATTKDVQEFLKSIGINWTGKIYNEISATEFIATDEHINKNYMQSYVCQIGAKTDNVEMTISNVRFMIYGRDINDFDTLDYYVEENLTEQWQEFLLKKYDVEYANILFAYYNKICKSISEKASREMIELDKKKEEVRLMADKKSKPFEKKQAYLFEKFLSKVDIEDILEL